MDNLNLEKLIITDEIRSVMAKYVRLADSKSWKSLASLFTPTGSFTPMDVSGAALIVMEGREKIAEIIGESVGDAIAIHHLFSYEMDVISDDRVHGVFAMEDQLIRSDEELSVVQRQGNIPPFRTLHGYGHYHGDFIKINGEWYISKLTQSRVKLDFTF